MLRVKIYLDPHGEESLRTELADIAIANVGYAGSYEEGKCNYAVYGREFDNPFVGSVEFSGITAEHNRKDSVFSLLKLVLDDTKLSQSNSPYHNHVLDQLRGAVNE